MSNLPTEWTLTTIGELSPYVQRGKSPKYTDFSELPVINQKCIRWHKLETQHLKFIHPDQIFAWDEARYIRPGDILWNSTGTGTVGRAYLISEADCVTPKVVDSHVTIVRACDQVDSRYLFNWIKGPLVQQKIEEMCDGTTNQIELSRRAITETEIPLPPLNEQKRIADKLDTLLAQVDACRNHLDRIPGILKRFRQSVLAAATSGKLTEEWREANGVSVQWSTSTIGELGFVTKLAGFEYTKFVKYQNDGDLKVIKAENAGRLGFKYTNFSTVYSEDVSMLTRSKLKGGDVLMVFVGAGTGQVAIVPPGNNWFLGPNIAMIRTNPEILNSAYLEHYCRSPNGCDEISKFIKSVAQPSLSMKTIRQVIIPLPIIDEQTEIVRRVESLFAYADRLEARYTTARAQVEKLTPSLLAKAFRGELTADWRAQNPDLISGENSAEALLAKIKAQREADKPTKKPKATKV